MKLSYLLCSCEKVAEKSNHESSKVIKNILTNKSVNPESLQK